MNSSPHPHHVHHHHHHQHHQHYGGQSKEEKHKEVRHVRRSVSARQMEERDLQTEATQPRKHGVSFVYFLKTNVGAARVILGRVLNIG